MALIQCPKCGQEISDNATSCPYCGYVFQKRENVSFVPKVSSKPFVTNPMVAWQVLCPQENKKSKICYRVIRAICVLLASIPAILLYLALIEVIYPIREVFQESNYIAQLALYSDYKNFLDSLFLASIVLGICSGIVLGIAHFRRIVPVIKWMEKSQFEVKPFLEEGTISMTGRKADAYWAAYCKQSPKGKIVWGVYSLIEVLSFTSIPTVAVRCMSEICLLPLENFIETREWKIGDYNSVLLKILIFIAVFLVIYVSVYLICSNICKNYLTAYVAKNKTK